MHKKNNTHAHAHIYSYASSFCLISSDFRKNSCGILLYFFPVFFLEFFAFLFAVCLARILIIGNKFVFNSTTLSTKRKSCSREEQRGGKGEGGAEINVAYALQMMEPGGATQSHTA